MSQLLEQGGGMWSLSLYPKREAPSPQLRAETQPGARGGRAREPARVLRVSRREWLCL